MFEILKVTVIFESGKVVKYQGGDITTLIGPREVNNIESLRDVVMLRVKDELCYLAYGEPNRAILAYGEPKRVILAYREKE